MELENNVSERNIVRKPRRSGALVVVVVILTIFISSIFGAVFGFMAGGISQKIFPNVLSQFLKKERNNNNTDVIRQQIVEDDSAVIDVVDKSSPAVVSIVITKDVQNVQDFFSNPFGFPDFFGQGINPFSPDSGSNSQEDSGMQKQTVGGGSGFLITSDGMIVTNRHVVSDTSADYAVLTSDGNEHPAKILAQDPVNDIAVIKIEGNDYQILTLGDSDSLKIGQTVVAIGNSLGEFSNTVSKGIVSGLRRNLTASGSMGQSETLSNIIQTDAAINPGNSGGPLLDIHGAVIGINVAMAQGAQNIGFAIPSNQIKKVIDQVKATGKITAPYLGIRYIPVDSQIKQKINFDYDYGALVVRGDMVTDFAVIPGSPADKAGIVENDVILEVNGTKIDMNNTLGDLIAKNNVGDVITLIVWHKGNLKDIRVKLAERK